MRLETLLNGLSQLKGQTKQLRDKPNLNINDLVLVKEGNLPPLKWRLGQIIELYSGNVRWKSTVKLKISLGKLKCPIYKLSFLPFSN
ncbi:hypothetical protein CEXT_274981 [Caerostris extrusa]|uniref:DUF5641 domain-containing protein n=1 Tax=Caerostris extrusa TaxID=172846 RepID=A0AAV4MMN6_CAEEX|nr:hypothetical protein CEXT_274981 [Caerostris extrusa]